MRQLVDQRHFRMSEKHGIEVHFFEDDAAILDVPARYDFEAGHVLLGDGTAVGFDDADDHVRASLSSPLTFVEHSDGLADTGGRAQVDAESAGGLNYVSTIVHHWCPVEVAPLSVAVGARSVVGERPVLGPGSSVALGDAGSCSQTGSGSSSR